jgi:hypothetical protein
MVTAIRVSIAVAWSEYLSATRSLDTNSEAYRIVEPLAWQKLEAEMQRRRLLRDEG